MPILSGIKLEVFKNEIITAVNCFIKELGEINPELLQTKMVLGLQNKLQELMK